MDARASQFWSDLSEVEKKIHALGQDWLWFFGRFELSDQEKASWAGLAESLQFIRACKGLIEKKSAEEV